jgi:hypothetical protein
MVTRNDNVIVSRFRRGKAGALEPVTASEAEFAPFAAGPALCDGFAYWVSQGRLVRRRFTGPSALEVLASDARDGTRVSAACGAGQPAIVAYIARAGDRGRLVARAWIDGITNVELTPEGAAANSVALATVKKGAVAITLEGRTAMTPLHARTVRVVAGKPELGPDVVAWVGGSAQPLTEVDALATDGKVLALLAMERDVTNFGLVRITIGLPPTMNAPADWQLYPNGLDPAPLAVAQVCDAAVAIFARPSEVRPHAPQELVLARASTQALTDPAVLARARTIVDVSVAPLERGALVVYVADRRTMALTLDCRKTR